MKFFNQNRIKKEVFIIFLCIFLSISILTILVNKVNKIQDINNAGSADGTSQIRASVDNLNIHCEDSRDIFMCLEDRNISRSKDHNLIWLGNSQLHSINQIQDVDIPAPAILHSLLKEKNIYSITLSQPNANIQEHSFILQNLTESLKIKYLILPVFFDDLRESGIRDSIKKLESLSSKVKLELEQKNINIDESSYAGLEGTPQKYVEQLLSNKLQDNSNIWKNQDKLRTFTLVNLYKLRNFIFQIKPTTTRNLIPARYEKNMNELEYLLNYISERNIKALIYIPPIRSDYKIPYDINDYVNFKSDLKRLVNKSGHKYANFENIVPSSYWGMKDSTSSQGSLELDFMHFQAGGHKILANNISDKLSELILRDDIK